MKTKTSLLLVTLICSQSWSYLRAEDIKITATATAPNSVVESTSAFTDAEAFARLKSLAGEWKGTTGSKEGDAAAVTYRVASGGTVVMETLFPGTPYEMISMYTLDHGSLVMTHYCAMGNQPTMRCVKAGSDVLEFDFTGGGNLDPARDVHVHSGSIRFVGPDGLEAAWSTYKEGKEVGVNRFFLTRMK